MTPAPAIGFLVLLSHFSCVRSILPSLSLTQKGSRGVQSFLFIREIVRGNKVRIIINERIYSLASIISVYFTQR